MSDFSQIADTAILQTTANALEANGIKAIIVENGEQAKAEVLKLIPQGARVMTMTSVTLKTLGITEELDESGNYVSVRGELATAQGAHKRELGAAPDWTIGSVHAVTQQGQVMIASNTGSQLAAYVYGAEKVIWVVGAQKLVTDLDEGTKRIYDYVLPLESERARQAYGAPGSFVSKLLIVNREVQAGRITVILVPEQLGF